MSLQAEIDRARGDIKTDNYLMSIGEWISLYENRELDIHPEFQRFYRWDVEQKSRLIESILLGIPIPPIFVAQRNDGVWDVVDGLQRLSTILEFAGILRDDSDQVLPPLILERTKYLPALEGKHWDYSEEPLQSFDAAQRMLIKRTKIGVSIILKESDPRTKFELFQRLNTGGSMLSDQEVRNCLLVMVSPDFYRWLSELARSESFQQCIALTDRALSEQYDVELALRFVVFRKIAAADVTHIGDVGQFLTERMLQLAEAREFNKVDEQRAFDAVFEFIHNAMGPDAFRKWVPGEDKYKGGFLVSAFEAVAIGAGHWAPAHLAVDVFETKVKELWGTSDFVENSGSGIRASTRIPKTVLLGREVFRA